MTTVATIMSNHFPAVVGAAVCKVGVILVSRGTPPGIGGLGIIPLKIALNVLRNLLTSITSLSHNELTAGGQQDEQECFHNSDF